MADITVDNADIEALGAKFESMGDQFSETEQASIQALFALAGIGLQSGSDVEGFAVDSFKPVNFEFQYGGGGSTQGVLIGLLKNPIGSAGVGGHMLKIEGMDHK